MAVFLGGSAVGFVTPPTAAAANDYEFGDDPWTEMYLNSASPCSELTSAELTVMGGVVAWAETVNGSTAASPSPMTMGRADYYLNSNGTVFRSDNLNLYSTDTATGEIRGHASSGVGMFQLDTLSNAELLPHWQRMDARTSAAIALGVMGTDYCSTPGTDAQRRAAAWSDWLACGAVNCEAIYQTVYDAQNDWFKNLTKDDSVGRYGGMIRKHCRFGNLPEFDCWFIDANRAEGWTGSWQGSVNGGNAGRPPSPLPLPYYSFETSGNWMRMYWQVTSTGYADTLRKNWDADTASVRTAGNWFLGPSTFCAEVSQGFWDCS